MSVCRVVFRRLPVCRSTPTRAALCTVWPYSSSPLTKRNIHAAPLSHQKLANPDTSEKEKKGGIANHLAKRFADFDLAGKVYVVTGGARGLGLTLAEALVEAGGRVYCVDRAPGPDEEWGQAQARVVSEWGGSLHYRQQDVSDTEHLDQLIQAISEENGRLDWLVAAAGIQQITRATEYSAQDAQTMMAINYTGVMQACTAAARQMFKRKTCGTMVIIASMSGVVANKGLLSQMASPGSCCADPRTACKKAVF
ncbi:D-arabinitol 2-dehydrogenase [Apiospora arundinis]|uniref:D-arabinitol 2-dehydrogenase n=1 Tax=Apiospora arundinis TaxID=335852 RepID=A0ABR2IXL4_9PEZI